MKLETYLRQAIDRDVTHFYATAKIDKMGRTVLMVRPIDTSGETMNYSVDGNQLEKLDIIC